MRSSGIHLSRIDCRKIIFVFFFFAILYSDKDGKKNSLNFAKSFFIIDKLFSFLKKGLIAKYLHWILLPNVLR